jgi:uncharacterized protein with HEPN domain
MRPESRKLLADMLDAARAVEQFIAGKSLADLRDDDLLRSGVYFKFLIIGEALNRLRQLDPSTAQSITEHARIVGFRNQIIHGYSQIDDEITWRIVERKLPVLIQELESLLAV